MRAGRQSLVQHARGAAAALDAAALTAAGHEFVAVRREGDVLAA